MKHIKCLAVAYLFVLFTAVNALPQQPGIKEVRKIEAYLNKLEAVGFTGSVLVELNGKKVLTKGYGYQNAAEKRKTRRTRFLISAPLRSNSLLPRS